MTALRLSRPADSDLRAALAVSRARFGAAAERRYAATLATALELIARDPHGPITRARPELGPDVRCLHTRRARGAGRVHAPVHVIYYRLGNPDMVEVIRILHERMDPARYVVPARTRRARR
jgi:toxin ParE1/3/4